MEAVEVSTIVIVFGFLILGLLALLNEHQIRKDLRVARDRDSRRFVCEELRRVRLRAAGWFLLFAALMVRITSDALLVDVLGTALGAAAVASFLADGILGRLERRRLLRGR